ncbi:UNVERIFIED_CONTAM: hypothetical protein PYX00_007936 [Menopon gallinae]|uniref:BZIP domain-containing protein n=1 Tax=Menopon gallinae TaxID=328185 RepID=A0AAW2HL76_9NEOP
MTSVLGWNTVPASPVFTEDDIWFFSEDDKNQIGLDDDFSSLSRDDINEQLVDDIGPSVKIEDDDTISQWLEEKVDLPIFDDLYPVFLAEDPKQGGEIDQKSLTPPESPENAESETYFTLDGNGFESFERNQTYIYVPECGDLVQSSGENGQPDGYDTAPPTPISDLEKELALVDEVVQGMAQNLEDGVVVWESENSHSQSSSSESVNNLGSPGSGGAEDESDDPEWTPTARKPTGRSARRAKPYSQQDRLLRKKEQNKEAATRYRQKKKAQASELKEEEKMLEERNEELRQELHNIQIEMKGLKKFMRDYFRIQGLLIN